MLQFMKGIERLKDIPVVMMSSDQENAIVAKCVEIGARDYLVKPIRIQHCKELKNHMIHKPRQVDPSKV